VKTSNLELDEGNYTEYNASIVKRSGPVSGPFFSGTAATCACIAGIEGFDHWSRAKSSWTSWRKEEIRRQQRCGVCWTHETGTCWCLLYHLRDAIY